MLRSPIFIVTVSLLALPGSARAQTNALVKRIHLAGENQQVGHRLHALDQQLNPLRTPHGVAKIITWSAPPCPWRACAGWVVENTALEKWEQSLDDYLKLLDEAGDALVPSGPVPPGAALPPPSVQARRLIHARLAALPASVLERYRLRVDAQAQKLWEEGRDRRSAAPLRRLVDESFCSRCGDQALDLLGDLAFEKGNFEEALAWWRLLVLPPSEARRPPADALLFPDPKVDLTLVRAKAVLAFVFMEQRQRAEQELAAFRQLHPEAQGHLAGAKGAYAQILATWIKKLSTHGPISNQAPWTTFAGNAARNRTLAVCPPARLWLDGPTWRRPLAQVPNAEDKPAPPRNPATRLATHPLIVRNQVLIAAANAVTSFDLLTGRPIFRFSLNENETAWVNDSGDRYTLSASSKHVFARLQAHNPGPLLEEEPARSRNWLVALALGNPDADDLPAKGKLHWKIPAATPSGEAAFFEGAPLAAEGRVYCAISYGGLHPRSAIVCYDEEGGRRRWWQDVCNTAEFEANALLQHHQRLLTMGGGKLYYCSQTGAMAALDPWSGQRLWSTRYSTRGLRTSAGIPSPRDLAPCLYFAGRLYLAPVDHGGLVCLDAADGRLIWEHPAVEVVHLLGASRGRVYFTTPRGLQCVNADDGTSHGCWIQPEEGRLPGLGRGLCAGSWLLWPTQDPKLPWRGVTLDSGVQERYSIPTDVPPEPAYLEPTMLRAIPPGNLAFGQDCLVVAGLEELVAYVPARYFLKEREENNKEARSPSPLGLYRLALAQQDAGLAQEARKSLGRLQELAKKNPSTMSLWLGLARSRSQAEENMEAKSAPVSLARPTVVTRPAKNNQNTTLPLPLRKSLEITTGTVKTATCPQGPFAGKVLGVDGPELFCLDPALGKIWKSAPAPSGIHEPTLWIGSYANFALRAQPDALAGFDLNHPDGKPAWIQPSPLLPPRRYFLQGNQPYYLDNPYPPAHFRSNNRLCYFMVDQRLLAALDPLTGKYAWQFWAPGGQLRPLADGGRFNPVYQAGDRYVLLQTTAGKRLTLDSQSGRVLHEGPAARPWPLAPLALDERRFILTDAAGKVFLLDAGSGEVSWTYSPPGSASLTGSPAHVFGDKTTVFAFVPRNLGNDLVRLDPATGKVLWEVALLPVDCDAAGAAFDNEAVYLTFARTLEAHALKDGAVLWKTQLPEGTAAWQIQRAGNVILAIPRQDQAVPWMPLGPSLLAGFFIKQALARPRSEPALLVINAQNGQWLQRLPLPATSGPITAKVAGNRLVVCAGGNLYVYGRSN